MVYLPLLEETGHMPTRKYVFADEIFAHAQRIGTQFDLYENALFSTSVSKLEWDETQTRWIIQRSRGCHPQNLLLWAWATTASKTPWDSWHRNFWAKSFTPADGTTTTQAATTGEPMVNLADKRVGIIGTGATAVQCIPHLAPRCWRTVCFSTTPLPLMYVITCHRS